MLGRLHVLSPVVRDRPEVVERVRREAGLGAAGEDGREGQACVVDPCERDEGLPALEQRLHEVRAVREAVDQLVEGGEGGLGLVTAQVGEPELEQGIVGRGFICAALQVRAEGRLGLFPAAALEVHVAEGEDGERETGRSLAVAHRRLEPRGGVLVLSLVIERHAEAVAGIGRPGGVGIRVQVRPEPTRRVLVLAPQELVLGGEKCDVGGQLVLRVGGGELAAQGAALLVPALLVGDGGGQVQGVGGERVSGEPLAEVGEGAGRADEVVRPREGDGAVVDHFGQELALGPAGDGGGEPAGGGGGIALTERALGHPVRGVVPVIAVLVLDRLERRQRLVVSLQVERDPCPQEECANGELVVRVLRQIPVEQGRRLRGMILLLVEEGESVHGAGDDGRPAVLDDALVLAAGLHRLVRAVPGLGEQQ